VIVAIDAAAVAVVWAVVVVTVVVIEVAVAATEVATDAPVNPALPPPSDFLHLTPIAV